MNYFYLSASLIRYTIVDSDAKIVLEYVECIDLLNNDVLLMLVLQVSLQGGIICLEILIRVLLVIKFLLLSAQGLFQLREHKDEIIH